MLKENYKIYLSFAVVMVILLLISACSTSNNLSSKNASNANDSSSSNSSTEKNSTNNTEDKQESIEIVWYLHTESSEQERKDTLETISEFEEKYPNVKVKTVQNADPDLLTRQQLAAGGGPDVIHSDGPTVLREFAAAGYLLPLEEYADQFGWEERFFPWAYNTVKYNDELYGLPGEYETLVVFYNKDMFAENGWEIPQSYEEIISLGENMQEKEIIPFAFGASDFKGANGWWLAQAYNQTLGVEEMKKVLTNEVPWTSPLMEEATEKLVNLWKKGFINERQSQAITGDDATTLFLSGKAAMKMEGVWLIGTLLDKKPSFDWGMFIMPSWREGVEANLPLALGSATGINANTKHPDEVAAFIDYLRTKEFATKEAVHGTFLPVKGIDTSVIEEPHVQTAFNLLKDLDESNSGFANWTYWPPSVNDFARRNIESVYLDQIDLKTYLEQVKEKFDEDVERGKMFKFSN